MNSNAPPAHAVRRVSLAAVAAALLLTACSPETPGSVSDSVRPVYVATARDAHESALSFVGEVRAARRAELAFAVTGRVAGVAVEVGDTVREGQLLANLDERPLQAQWAAAGAEAQRAQAQVDEARQRLERLRGARQAQAASAAEWGAAELELTSAEAALQAARAQRDQASWALEQARLRAPIAGVVVLRTLERGQAAGPGVPALAIDGQGRELVIQVPATLGIQVGQKVTLHGQGQHQESRVLRLATRLDAGGVRKVWLAVPDAAAPGSTWSVALQADADTVRQGRVQVPLRAVRPTAATGTGTALRLAADGQTLEPVNLALGEVQGDWIEVTQGLQAGERVVVAGAHALRPGQKVQPVATRH